MQCFSLDKPWNISRAIWFMKFIPCHRTVKLARTFSTNIYLRLIKNWLDEIWTRAKKMVFIWNFHTSSQFSRTTTDSCIVTNRETKLIWLQRGLFVLTNYSKNVLGTLSYGRNLALFTMRSSCYRTLRHLWSVLPLIWFVLVPCSFEISLHSCCIVACTSSPICYVDGIPVLLLVLLQCFELWDRAEATDYNPSYQLSKSSLCDVILDR